MGEDRAWGMGHGAIGERFTPAPRQAGRSPDVSISSSPSSAPALRVGVVIPTLREAATVGGAVASAWAAGAAAVVVADAGSPDSTVEAAREAGAETVVAPRGRAAQMNAGAAALGGRVDVLCFLHADTRLEHGAADAIADAVAQGAEAGVFRLRFDRPTPLLRLYAQLSRLPIAALTFGDRALWVRRGVFEAIGGFPEIAAFEDVEMARRLARRRRLVRLALPVTTSSRRFATTGTLRQQATNARLWLAYLAGADPDRLAAAYRYDASRG